MIFLELIIYSAHILWHCICFMNNTICIKVRSVIKYAVHLLLALVQFQWSPSLISRLCVRRKRLVLLETLSLWRDLWVGIGTARHASGSVDYERSISCDLKTLSDSYTLATLSVIFATPKKCYVSTCHAGGVHQSLVISHITHLQIVSLNKTAIFGSKTGLREDYHCLLF